MLIGACNFMVCPIHVFRHRDLKSDNCLVNDLDRVKVADFGTSRKLQKQIFLGEAGLTTPKVGDPNDGLGYNLVQKKTIKKTPTSSLHISRISQSSALTRPYDVLYLAPC